MTKISWRLLNQTTLATGERMWWYLQVSTGDAPFQGTLARIYLLDGHGQPMPKWRVFIQGAGDDAHYDGNVTLPEELTLEEVKKTCQVLVGAPSCD